MARRIMPDYLKSEFVKIINRNYFSKEANPIREKAFNHFTEHGLPNRKDENWRFTNLSALKKSSFRIPEKNDAPKTDHNISEHELESLHTIVIYNGHFQENLSPIPNGLRVLSNQEYMEQKDWAVFQPTKSSFDLLNTAFMDSGVSLIVDKGVEIKEPIRLLFICDSNEKLMTTPRIHVDLEESSSLSFFEQHVGDCNEYFFNQSIFVNIEKSARLEHIRLQNSSKSTINMGNLHVKQQKDSSYDFVQFAFGGKLGRIDVNVDLCEEGANSSIMGLSLSDHKQHLDVNVTTNHYAPNCTSNQNFKSILKDNSSGVFNGRAIVHVGAQKTDSSQSNKNLLLSKDALMNSNPQLEIYADDVKCSHGSSTGALESDALFYIRSRGIDQEAATALLVHGFASEIIEVLKDHDIQELVIKYFNSWLEKNNQ